MKLSHKQGLARWFAPTILLLALTVVACSTTVDVAPGVRQRGEGVFIYQGPEVEAIVRTHQAERDLAQEWLVLALQIRATSGVGIVSIERSAISVRTPDGRRLPLISQDDFRTHYGEFYVSVRRALLATPPEAPWDRSLRRCDSWFLVPPTTGFATDEVFLDSFEYCFGPLVFRVSGGIQPGRWRLVIDLEESRVDVPFEVEVDEYE